MLRAEELKRLLLEAAVATRRGAEGGDAGKSLFLKMGRSRETCGKIEEHMGNSWKLPL